MTAEQGYELVRQAPPPGFYLGVLCVIALVALWGFYIEWRFKNCKCTRKPTLLRPRWKKVDTRKDYDTYDDE